MSIPDPYSSNYNLGPSKDAALWDKICGGACFAGGLCSGVAGLFASAILAFWTNFYNQMARSNADVVPSGTMPAVGAGVGMVMAVFVAAAIVQFCIGCGMWNSRKWAFIAALPTYGLCAIASIQSVVGFVVSLALVVYSICRLNGSVGPAPN